MNRWARLRHAELIEQNRFEEVLQSSQEMQSDVQSHLCQSKCLCESD